MRINSKEKFIKLFVCVLAQMGCTIETCDFESDLIKMISVGKYEDLFYFFEDISDFDFMDILLQMQKDGLILVDNYLTKVRIEILNKLFYKVGDQILSGFDEKLICLMRDMLRELMLSRSLTDNLPRGVQGIYRLTNPNKVYTIGSNQSIVTDGLALNINRDVTGACIVQNSNFVFLQSFVENKLKEIQVFYKFEDQRWLYNKIKEVLSFYRRLMESGDREDLLTSEEYSCFESIKDVQGFRYKRY